MRLQSLNDVLVHELQDLHSAEQQLIAALPKMAGAATSDKLRTAFEDHLGETRHHLERIEDVCSQIGVSPNGERCKGMPLLLDGDPLGVDEFATHHLPLDDGPDAYAKFQKKEDGYVKVLLRP